jgi:hypothetical protein
MSRRPNTPSVPAANTERSRLECVLTAGLANEKLLARTRFVGLANRGVSRGFSAGAQIGNSTGPILSRLLESVLWGDPSPEGQTLDSLVKFTRQRIKSASLKSVSELMTRFLPIEGPDKGSVEATKYDPEIHMKIILEALYNPPDADFTLEERVLFLLYAKKNHVAVVNDVKRNGGYDDVVANGLKDTIGSWKGASRFKAGARMVL